MSTLAAASATAWEGALARARDRLRGRVDDPQREAELLLMHVARATRAQLAAGLLASPTGGASARYENLVERRAAGEPLAYLTGEKEFWSLKLSVTPDVLIPRPETELLVEWALETLRDVRAPRIADLGTGSGAIALALASERGDARVIATDASDAALNVARLNAQRLEFANVEFRRGSWCQVLEGEYFDLIASNPPYVADGDPHLEDLRHEPAQALISGADGLDAIREIARSAPAHLKPGGRLLLEHGYRQGEAMRELLARSGFVDVATRRDLAGHERASGARGA